jgi:hypothetical protein
MSEGNFPGDLMRGGIAALIISIPLLVWVGQKQSWFRSAGNAAATQEKSWRDKVGYSAPSASPSPTGGSTSAPASQTLVCDFSIYSLGNRTLKIMLDEPLSQGVFDFTDGAKVYPGVYSPTQITFTARPERSMPDSYFTYSINRRDLSLEVLKYRRTTTHLLGHPYYVDQRGSGTCSLETVDTSQNKI